MKGERRTTPGKKVYDVLMNPEMNEDFVRVSKAGKRAYYPASQESRFKKADGGYVEGYHYLQNSLVKNKTAIESKMVEVAAKAIDQVLKKR